MDFQEMIEKQRNFDLENGFILTKKPLMSKYNQISHELIGLIGEIGELANIVKKINLLIDNGIEIKPDTVHEKEDGIREELIDAFIYLIRISDIFELDLEKDYLEKLEKNIEKYGSFYE